MLQSSCRDSCTDSYQTCTVSHTNRRSIKNTIGVVMNRLVSMGHKEKNIQKSTKSQISRVENISFFTQVEKQLQKIVGIIVVKYNE